MVQIKRLFVTVGGTVLGVTWICYDAFTFKYL